ncbi:unnamed protein product, partial [Ectocarpus sp. 8 AP-2014]
ASESSRRTVSDATIFDAITPNLLLWSSSQRALKFGPEGDDILCNQRYACSLSDGGQPATDSLEETGLAPVIFTNFFNDLWDRSSGRRIITSSKGTSRSNDDD